MAVAAEKKHLYPCPGCGATLEFGVGTRDLACPYCGRSERIPETEDQVDENSFEAYLETEKKPKEKLGASEVRCGGCGATVETSDALARPCPFCGAGLVAMEAAADLVAPEAVLPFRIDRSGALAAFAKWIASRWFAPSDLKKLSAREGIRGIYVPHWTFDTFTRTFYTGERGEHYYVTESYTVTVNGRSERRTRQVRRTRWYPASGRVERFFDDVLVPAVTSLPQDDLEKLDPWDLERLEAFRPEFLAGYDAARYDVDPKAGFSGAKEKMRPVIEGDCRDDIGGDEQRLHSVKTAYSAITFKHVLLPVWSAGYRYRNRTWRVFVNARTGEVIGERPWSVVKIVAAVLVVAAIVAGVVFAIADLDRPDSVIREFLERIGIGG